jgi:hypothetical protein
MTFVWLMMTVVIVLMLVDVVVRKALNIKRVKLTDPKAKKLDVFGRVLCAVIIFVAFPPLLDNGVIQLKYLFMILFTVLFSFQAILQYIYIKESKEYIITLLMSVVFIVFMLNIDFLIDLYT